MGGACSTNGGKIGTRVGCRRKAREKEATRKTKT
jgi:hypothetical protein